MVDAAVIEQLSAAQLRDVLPGFLAGYVGLEEAAVANRKRISSLVDTWSESALEQVLVHLRTLGTEARIYQADPHCQQLARIWCVDVLTETTLSGTHHLEAAMERGPTVIISNHLSYFDTTTSDAILAWAGCGDLADRLVTAAGPKVYEDLFRKVAAAGLATLPVPQSTSLGHTAHLTPKDLARQALHSVRLSNGAIEAGRILQIYPEGSRTRTGRLRPFLKGVHRYLAVPQLQIVPAAITGTDVIFPIDAHQLTPGPVSLTYGAPIDVGSCDSPRAALFAAHAAVGQLLPAALQPDPDAPALQ